ncbi:unnamed protein product [Camellia sinensis]
MGSPRFKRARSVSFRRLLAALADMPPGGEPSPSSNDRNSPIALEYTNNITIQPQSDFDFEAFSLSLDLEPPPPPPSASLTKELNGTMAIEYLEDNKTQTEIIDILHNTYARLIPFEQKLEIIELLLKACDAVENYVKKVRDKATLYLNMLEVDGAIVETDKDVKNFLFGSLDVPLVNLEMSLKNYVQEPSEEPFDIDSVPKEVKSLPLAEKKAPGKKPTGFGKKPTGLGAAPTAPTSTVDAYEKLLSSIPEFSSFGKLFKSSAPVELTEAETEYAVNAVQHIFDRHVVFQYNCTNSIPEQLLENVTVVVDASDTEKFTEVSTRPLRSLPYDSPGQTFVVFEKPEGVPQLENSRTLLGSLQNPSQLSKKQQKQEREWFAVSFKPENFIPGLVIGFIFGLFLDLSKPIKNNNNTTPKKAANLLLGKQQRLVSTNTDEELKMILRASMEGFLDAFMEQVTAFPNRLSRTRAEASIKIQNVWNYQ